MLKKIIPILFISFSSLISTAQLVINEIMYNSPEAGEDKAEFIEIKNITKANISLLGYSFTSGITMNFGDTIIKSGAFIVITKDKKTFKDFYGFEPLEWKNGSLSDKEGKLILRNPQGNIVDIVLYNNVYPWPTRADGNGYSLELCDAKRNNNLYQNWQESSTSTGRVIEGKVLYASPGKENEISCDIKADHIINVLSFAFSPKSLSINEGETVKWVNKTGKNHNIDGSKQKYSGNPENLYSGPPDANNWEYTFRFNIPGTYKYESELYANTGMKATIEVLPKVKTNLVITEIMYDDPGSKDSLEFVEIVNTGDKPINLNYFTFQSKEINFTFPNLLLNNNEFLILAKYPEAIRKYFGVEAIAWGNGELKNLDNLVLKNFFGSTVDKVDYWYNSPWPIQAAGYGKSINLCRPDLDNNLAANWQESPINAGFNVEGKTIYANPGFPGYCKYSVDEITNLNTDGTLKYNDLGVKVYGTVHGVNLNKGGLEFTLMDDTKQGISAYSKSDNFGYVVKEGNKLTAIGKTNQVNGLARIDLEEIIYTIVPGQIVTPVVVEALNEETESQVVTLKNVSLVNPADWGEGSTGFNVEVTNGVKNFMLRIDDDVDLFKLNYPKGKFNVSGIGGQYDTISPFFEGYQLLPRYLADIEPYIPGKYNRYPVGLITTVNADGIADSLGIKCEIEGVVYGINNNPAGLNFTLIDNQNDGINIFSQNNNLAYSVLEGDEIRVKGTVAQLNGLIEMIPDKIELISQGNNINSPISTKVLNESTESQLIEIKNASWVNPADWKGNGSSFNINMKNDVGTFTVRIESSTDLANMTLPAGGIFNLRGIGSQSDTQIPYLDSYRILPRYLSDFKPVAGLTGTETTDQSEVEIYPNPAKKAISIFYNGQTFDYISIFDYSGKLMKTITALSDKQNLDVSDLLPGVYYFSFSGIDSTESKKVVITK